ncbi:MAG TPA: FeoA domain-containing protein [Clostridia bacterium]|jgi:Fe2+ transport system protein FeoA|nr:MAG: Ferrous iron transport protein A [Firmicutes bacterium ADurb.Bin099]HHT96152.1 ferrous iron transport protein A [Clostridiaceae bacterium]HNZ41504.1 FeoA domain-containing protein [Clostridia bacterium]HOF26625.1 FeoA domain-containing protein [Clostridia bacterium]HOM34318.1 FeoA domain-containing protein [Clostridia bacterium]
MTLDKLGVGKSGRIIAVRGHGRLRHRLLDMGLTPRVIVHMQRKAPMGDPVCIYLRGYELTLRLEDASMIDIEEISV